MGRFMTAIFCDDIRKEEGNKLSYMGIYNSGLRAPTFPLVLPKLCVAMSLHCQGSGHSPTSLTFTLHRDDELLGEVPVNLTQAGQAVGTNQPLLDDQNFVTTAVLQFFPLLIQAPCKLKARAMCDGQLMRGGVLAVELAPAT